MTVAAAPWDAAASQAVDGLLAPYTVTQLIAEHWGRECLVRADGLGSFPKSLPSEADFEQLMATLSAPQDGWFSLVKDRARPPDGDLLNAEGWLSLPEVYAVFRTGHSLLLNQVQKRHRGVGELCRSLEAALTAHGVLLARHIGANLYLSPSNSQGFSIHYDPHDVLVLQLEGVKHWTLYAQRAPFPLEPPAQSLTPDQAGEVLRTFTMAAGDLIYLPRGVLHEARTSDCSSLHLTLSLEPATWRDFFTEAMKRSPHLRQSLPVGFAPCGQLTPADQAAIREMAGGLAAGAGAAVAALAAASQLLIHLDRMPGPGPSELARQARIGVDTPLRLAAGVFGKVVRSAYEAILHLPGASFAAGPGMAAAFEHMLTHAGFTARELPTGQPPEETLPFLRNLVLSGFIMPAAPAVEASATAERRA